MTVLCSRSQFGLISEFVTGPIFSLKRTLETSKCSILQLGRRKSKATLMSKGKRRGGLSGVSKFVLESMKPTSSKATSDLSKESPSSEQNRPAKRRKGNNSVPVIDQTEPAPLKWVEKYDATGLVPHYTHHSQVPAHLQKCMSRCIIFSYTQNVIHSFDHRFFTTSSIFFSLFRISWLSS